MSKSFTLLNGDLQISGGGYGVVSGKQKLLQDLRCWILEEIGTDPATPSFGSKFLADYDDGGFIGGLASQAMTMEIYSEVQDILERYQRLQLSKIQDETARYQGQHTLSPEEIIEEVDSIETTWFGTLILVRVSLFTLAGDLLQLTFPVTT